MPVRRRLFVRRPVRSRKRPQRLIRRARIQLSRKSPRRRTAISVRRRRIVRRSGRKLGRRFVARIKDALTAPDQFDIVRGDVNQMPASTIQSMPCMYITSNTDLYDPAGSSGLFGLPVTVAHPPTMQTIAYTINPAANQSIKFQISSFIARHQLYNSSTAPIRVVAYKCRCRSDLPLNSNVGSILNILGDGFLNAGIGSGTRSSNTGLTDELYTPFESPAFVERFAIVATRKARIDPGMSIYFSIKDHRDKVIYPNKFIDCGSGNTYANGTLLTFLHRGDTFWMFKLSSGALFGDNTGAGSINVPSSTSAGIVVRMLSNFHWTYRYVQDNGVSSTGQYSGLQAPVGANQNLINPLTGQNQNANVVR